MNGKCNTWNTKVAAEVVWSLLACPTSWNTRTFGKLLSTPPFLMPYPSTCTWSSICCLNCFVKHYEALFRTVLEKNGYLKNRKWMGQSIHHILQQCNSNPNCTLGSRFVVAPEKGAVLRKRQFDVPFYCTIVLRNWKLQRAVTLLYDQRFIHHICGYATYHTV